MYDRDTIVATARQLIGVRYRHRGCSLAGVDCLGVLLWTAQQLGVATPAVDYTRNPSGRRMVRLLREYLQAIRPSEALPGDVLHLAYGPMPQHLAIVTAPGRILHADSAVGHVVEHALVDPWPARVRGAYCLPGVV